MDADKFPVYLKSENLIKEYESIWAKYPDILEEIREKIGFVLEMKES